MRRLIPVVVLLALGVSLYAQAAPKSTDSIYVRTIPIIKIYSHQLGYKIYYLTEGGKGDSFYVPVDWFTADSSKGTITYGSGPQYPYMSIYWINKKFDHIKLFLIESPLSDTWGILRDPPSALADLFKVDEPKLKSE